VGWVGVTFPPPPPPKDMVSSSDDRVFASALDTRGKQESRNGIDFAFLIFFVQRFLPRLVYL